MRNLRVASAIVFVQVLAGLAVTVRPGSVEGYAPLFTLPVAFSLLPGSYALAFILGTIDDRYGSYLELVHYRGPTPGFPWGIWIASTVAVAALVLWGAYLGIRGSRSRVVYVGLFVAETVCVLSPVFSMLHLRYGYASFVMSVLVILAPFSALILLLRACAAGKPHADVQASTEWMKKGIWVALAFNLIMLTLVVWVGSTIGHFPDCGSYTPDSCDIPRNAVAGEILVSLLVIWALVMSLLTLIAVLTVRRTTYRTNSAKR
jgi:hypothetical protein